MKFLCSLALAVILWAAGTPAYAQAILQGGPWTPGHVPGYVGQGMSQPVVMDGGPAGGGGVGTGISEMGLIARGTGIPPYVGQGTGPFGTNFCDYDAPITNPTGYHFLCLSANVGGNGIIAYGAGGMATPGVLNFIINGITYTYPPPSSTGTNITVVTVTASGTITLPPASEYVLVNKTVPANTLVVLPLSSNWPTCPASALSCPVYTIKDAAYNSGTYPITITAADGKNIENASSYILNSNGDSVDVFLSGSAWFVK